MTSSKTTAPVGDLDLASIRVGHSCATQAREAVRQFHAEVAQPDGIELVLFFCSSQYDLDALASEMRRLFAGVQVVGCTTAGEIGPLGYRSHSLSGASFPAGSCAAVSGVLGDLRRFSAAGGQEFTQTLLRRLEQRLPGAAPDPSFAFMLIDGMSMREEGVAHALQGALGKIPMFGGSAGDDFRFAKTHVYCDGHFHADSAALILVSTCLPFRIFMTQHFVSGNEALVVTQADTARRMVTQINGLPAAEVYARCVGVAASALKPAHFAASPVVVRIGGTDYVRAIQQVHADGSLSFLCAIEEGLVLRVARGVDMAGNLERAFDWVHAEIGAPQLVLACDCVLRALEVAQDGLAARIERIFQANQTIGFSSYGEQIHGVHVNQTLTGIAIGGGRPDPAPASHGCARHRDAVAPGAGAPALNYAGVGAPGEAAEPDWRAIAERQDQIIRALINRAEYPTDIQGSDFTLFQSAIMLEDQVRRRTSELEQVLRENQQITHALRVSENHHRLLVENSPMCIHEISLDGRITSMNQSGLDMMGVADECQICGLHYLDAVCDADRGRIGALLDQAYAGRGSQFEFASSGREPRMYSSCFVPIKNKHGGVDKLMGITEDITARKRTEEMLRKLSIAVEQSSASVVITDLDARIEYVNPRFSEVTGYSLAEAIGCNPRILQSGQVAAEVYADMWGKLTGGLAWEGELLNKRKCGALYWEETHVAPVKNPAGAVTHYVAVKTDITERKRMEEQVRRLAFYDGLTGLPNRRLLSDRLAQAMAAGKRSGRYCALLFLDLDNFKPINDLHGHDVGDLLLVEAARRLKACMREVDTLARFGGDEFVVVLGPLDGERATAVVQAGVVAEKIRVALAQPYVLAVRRDGAPELTVRHRCSVSIGVALFFDRQASQDDILKWADTAMYQAKAAGRDLIRFYEAPLDGAASGIPG